MKNILIVDDDKALSRSLQLQLGALGYTVLTTTTAADGLTEIEKQAPDLLLLDVKLPDRTGIEVLHELQSKQCDFPVVMITGYQNTKPAIEAMRAGAFDYVRKPFDFDQLLLIIEKADKQTNKAPDATPVKAILEPDEKHEIIGNDRKIVEVIKQIGLLSRSRVTVLIQGESGTGKELVARALHQASAPAEPFVALNCSAVVGNLLENELFGHEKGAFTGAESRKLGKLEYAGEGTLFLDEIGDMPVDLQAKLLRVLQEREFERVGGLQPIPFNARVVAATHRDLNEAIREGTFRQDLYYRLAVSQILLPPLHSRKADIRLLANHLLVKISRKLHRHIEAIDEDAMKKLESYDWPGNVREMENVLTRAVALAKGNVVTAESLKFPFDHNRPKSNSEKDELLPLREAEKNHIAKALAAKDWNITHTAKALEISPTTLRKKISDFGLAP